MELSGICPGGQLGDEVELAQQLAHHLAGIVALAQPFELAHDPRQGIFRLTDRHVRVVLTLPLEARVVFAKFLTKEVGETLARGVSERLRIRGSCAVRQDRLENHLNRKQYPV